MSETFWKQLKRVKIRDVLHVFKMLLAVIPALIYKRIRKNMYLVCEYSGEAHDNGYWFFKYVSEHHKNQDIVYAIDKSSSEYQNVASLGQVIQFGSLNHWICFLSSKVNISSQKGGKPNAAICYLLEVVLPIIKVNNVFLQHGVTINNLTYLHAKNAKIDLFMCSANPEYEFVKKHFGYGEKALSKAGMCRFDSLDNSRTDNKKVLIAPTWRKWLKEIESEKDIRQTNYFLAWNELLNDSEFIKTVDNNNLEIYFYLHSHVSHFSKYFDCGCDKVKILNSDNVNLQELINQCGYMITDFSSTIIDFAYTYKRGLYYQFDYEEYREKHQEQGYFSYENDGFGVVCYTKDELLDEFKMAAVSKFKNPNKYKKRANEFFVFRDNKNCERTYNAIKNL